MGTDKTISSTIAETRPRQTPQGEPFMIYPRDPALQRAADDARASDEMQPEGRPQGPRARPPC